jgi:hypothetical protein
MGVGPDVLSLVKKEFRTLKNKNTIRILKSPRLSASARRRRLPRRKFSRPIALTIALRCLARMHSPSDQHVTLNLSGEANGLPAREDC